MEPFDTFCDAESAAQQHEAVRRMFTEKRIHAAVSQPEFERGLTKLARAAETVGSPEERLLALATLGRLATLNKAMRSRVEQIEQRAVAEPLPVLRTLDDPDDRGYVTDACRFSQAGWVVPFLAVSAIDEVGEKNKARDKMLAVLLEKTGSVSELMNRLGEAFQTWRPDTESPADSAARRLRLVIGSLMNAVSATPCSVGSDVGKRFARLVQGILHFQGQQASSKVAAELSDPVLSLVHELIRHRFLLATEATLYDAISAVRGGFGKAAWLRYVEESQPLRLLAEDIAQAIALMARQGRADDELFQRLIDAKGSKEGARRRTKKIAETEQGIPASIQAWLSGERVEASPASELADAVSRQLAFEESRAVAILLREGARLAAAAERSKQELLPDVSLAAPRQGTQLETLIAQGLAVADAIHGFAGRRQLILVGKPGEIVEFSPSHHALDRAGVRRVRIVQPAVEEVREGGVRSVVLKAVVEPLAESAI